MRVEFELLGDACRRVLLYSQVAVVVLEADGCVEELGMCEPPARVEGEVAGSSPRRRARFVDQRDLREIPAAVVAELAHVAVNIGLLTEAASAVEIERVTSAARRQQLAQAIVLV